uniref:Uncharacterized protein n=1 Tax=Arundo donax TaxID=35708 RepID=A0A0A9CAT0_ARUDO
MITRGESEMSNKQCSRSIGYICRLDRSGHGRRWCWRKVKLSMRSWPSNHA